ncbi:prepilin peptidase [Paractinoplanes globisporus]|uniref:Prepilin peptidase n=1 Tax=Paractinoplanes globisporus TaxID=113565 RepID=A0ABW6WPF8_9ACTN|nr:prepilin peptidase [Actinoplanes globisporus]
MSPLLVILAAAFGAASSAFLPRLAHRFAVGHADQPRAGCAICQRPFVPGFPGWVRAGAACSCSGGFGWTVATGATVAGLLAVVIGPSPLLPAYLLASVPAVLLAMIDLRCLRLPDRLVGAVAASAGLPLALLRPDRIVPALVAAVTVLTAYAIGVLLGGLGLGDLKLAAVLALILGFAGWPAVLVGVLAPHLIGGPIAMFLLVTGRRRVLPFGPALLVGALIGLTAA